MRTIGRWAGRTAEFVRNTLTSLPHTTRSLRRSPGFVGIAALSLGAALGLSTSVFALIDAMRHPQSPYRDVDQVYAVWVVGNARVNPNAREVQEGLATIRGIGQLSSASVGYTDVETPEAIVKAEVSFTRPGYFELLRPRVRLGRLPSPADAQNDNAAVVSDEFWRAQFGNRDLIGDARLTIAGHAYHIVGVLPPHASWFLATDVWIPQVAQATAGYGVPVVRLRPGVTPEQVQPQLNAIMTRLTAEYVHAGDKPFGARLVSLRPDPLTLRDFHRAMIGAAIFVLIIACANVAALMLARGAVRTRDYALRLALGASRADIAREVMVEVAALAALGSVAGAVVATWAVGLMTRATPAQMHWLGFAAPQWSVRVLATSGAAVFVAVAIAGGIPAWRASRTDPAGTIKEGAGGTTGRSGTRFRWLVVTELALSMTLLVGAALMLKSEALMSRYDFGFDTRRVLSAQAYVRYTQPPLPTAQLVHAYQDALDRVRNTPGVESAAMADACAFDRHPIVTTDRTIEGGKPLTLPSCTNVSPGYFSVFGWSVVAGRDFTDGDAAGDGAVILDRKTARRLFPHESAIGHKLKLGDLDSKAPWITVVGIIQDRYLGFNPYPEMGKDTSDVIFTSTPDSVRDVHTYVVRTAPGALRARIAVTRALIDAFPPHGSFTSVGPWTAKYDETLAEEHFLTLVFTMLGVASLILGAAGLFSVVSYIASQRMREYAVRIALGATRENLARLVLGEALLMALGGTAIGAGLGMWAGFLIWDKMYGVYPVDVTALVAAEATLLVVTLASCLAPALRATRANPVDVLRAT